MLHRALAAIGIEVDDAERDTVRLGPTTRAAVTRLQVLLGMPSAGQIDRGTVELARTALGRLHGQSRQAGAGLADGESIVEGVVYDVNGFPLAGVNVVAQRRGLRDASVLGRAGTDAGGRYRIVYPTPTDTVSKGAGVDLELEVLGADDALLYRSPVHHRVGARVEVALALSGEDHVGPPELARLAAAVGQRLGTLRPEEIVERGEHRDLTFLADATGMDKSQIAYYAVAARLATSTGLPLELFYALFRQGVPADARATVLAETSEGIDLDANGKRLLEAVFVASPEIRAQAVETAIATDLVSPEYAKRAPDDLARLTKLATSAARSTPLGTNKTPIGTILDAAAIPVPKQERFLTLYRESNRPGEGFWEELAQNPDFTAQEVATLRFATIVGQFTRGHMPLVNRLLRARTEANTRALEAVVSAPPLEWQTAYIELGTEPGLDATVFDIATTGQFAYATHYTYNPNDKNQPTHAGRLVKIDLDSREIVDSVVVGHQPRSVAVNPLTNTVYVVNRGHTSFSLMIIQDDGGLGDPVEVRLGQGPTRVAVSPARNRVFVTNPFRGRLHVLDGTDGRTLTEVVLGTGVTGVAVDDDEDSVYVTVAHRSAVPPVDRVAKFVPDEQAPLGTVRYREVWRTEIPPELSEPIAIAVDSEHERVYVGNLNAPEHGGQGPGVTILGSATGAVIATVPTGSSPWNLAASARFGYVYAPQSVAVSIIDLDNRVVGTIPHELPEPFGVAVHPDSQQVLLGDGQTGKLMIATPLPTDPPDGQFQDTRTFARLSAAQWKAMLLDASNGPPVGVPDEFSAQDPEQAVEEYAYLLERDFEQLHPTTAFSARLGDDETSPLPAKTAVVGFLASQPAFDLSSSDVDGYLKDQPDAVADTDRPAVRESLLISQRVFRLTNRYAVARPLLADRIHSAHQIYAMGRSSFMSTYSGHPDMGSAEAAQVYTAAEQTYGMALSCAMNYNAQLVGVSPAALGPTPSAQLVPNDRPNLQTLFGSLDLCACQHCRSVLSPAAYLVDMLHFLAQRTAVGWWGLSLTDLLLSRRLDLAQIELSCANTNTVLSHIDLVNELLEDAVAPPPDPVAAARARQTTLTSEELGTNPEYVNDAAYATLGNAVFPWRLPFDLPLAEARTYLGMLGTDRVALMRALKPPAAPGSVQATALAVEGLGMSAVEVDIITPLVTTRKSWDYWGLAETGNTVRDPVDHTVTVTGSWIEVLSGVRILLDRAGLAYQELTRLLNTRFVNPTGAVTLDPPESCDLATMTVSGLTGNDVLDRLHRFVRLQRRLGWDVYDTDAAVALLQAGTPEGLPRLNLTLLRQLYAVKTAVSRWRIPVPAAVALFARIDTRDVPPLPGEEQPRRSLYIDLFANRAVLNPVDPIFTLNAARTEIAAIAANPKLADHRPALVAAFELSDDELVVAIEAFTNGALTLANLSTLYRHVILARGLILSIRELISLRALVERPTDTAPVAERIDPFDPTRPELLTLFCDEVDRIRASRFSIAELTYLLRHTSGPTAGAAPDEVAVGTLLRSIRDKLAKLADENAAGADPTGAGVRQRLAAALLLGDVDAVMAILAGTSTLADDARRVLISAKLGPYVDVAATQAALVGAAALPAGPARYEFVLAQLLADIRRTLGTSLVVQELTDALGLPTATVATMLTDWFRSFKVQGAPLVTDFLALPGLARDPSVQDHPIGRTEPGFAPYFDAYARLAKLARVVTGFGLTAEDTAWLRSFGVAVGWLDPTTLPMAPAADAQGRYARWRRLADAVAVKAALGADGTPFTTLMDLARNGATKQAYLQALSARTGWPAQTLRPLTGDPANAADRGLLNLAYPDDYRSEVALARLVPAFGLLDRLGAGAGVSGWIGPTVSAAQAQAIKQSVKAKYSAQQWPTVAKPPRDALRERQRDALLDYLLAHPPTGVGRWHDPSDVYAHYLIDVQMSACQGTSRIVQATAAVQLFVQRCILNLEPGIVVDAAADADWLQWQWMNRYRVWEANRQVFLYPENWISPALRRDKSPFFKDLENELLQAEVTKDTAEGAFRHYLEKLNTVARLDVVGLYHEQGTPTRLHVVARKPGHPSTYYHRMWIGSSRWTAWTKIDLDITSDHVLPLVWRGRLHLFWATVSVKPNATQPAPLMLMSNAPAPPAEKHTEIKLSWSEFKGNTWLPTETAPQAIVAPLEIRPSSITFRSWEYSTELRIELFIQFVDSFIFHTARFALSGAGNPVEAFMDSDYTNDLLNIGRHYEREIGKLLQDQLLPDLEPPAGSRQDRMGFVPSSPSVHSPTRLRIAPMHATYRTSNSSGSLPLQSSQLLRQADWYRLTVAHQQLQFDSTLPFFYADRNRQYFIIPEPSGHGSGGYKFEPFYHRYIPLFLRQLNRGGVDTLFDRRLQLDPAAVEGTNALNFSSYYQPTSFVASPHPTEGVDFGHNAGYAIYNWELFFHAPFQIGQALSRNQRFAEAKRWYEYVFNPTSTTSEPAPRRFWVTKPFNLMQTDDYWAQAIQNLMQLIHQGDPVAEQQVAQWRATPFDPDVIAGLRPVAYQRAIVMKYLDNLIAWGDQLFRQDTLESVNEATQLYVLAAELLGPRPEIVPRRDDGPARTYAEIEGSLDDFSNAITVAENLLPPPQVNVPVDPGTPQLPVLRGLYFAIPPNDQLLRYWDLVADRLFKVRHCLNIEGVERQLALFAPPIDPGLLVKAAAAGLDLASVAGDSGAALPPYRFRVILREAIELAEHVRSLSAELLACLEKRDADGLDRLRASSEVTLQKRIRDVQDKTVEEADQQIEIIAKNREVVTARQTYYAGLKDELMNSSEAAGMEQSFLSLIPQTAALALDVLSAVAFMFPNFQFGASGVGGTPHVTLRAGGEDIGRVTGAFATAAKTASAMLQTGAQMSAVTGGYVRRKEEWRFQHDQATKELEHLDAQEVAAQIRQDIAIKNRDNHEVVVANATAVDEYLHGKFTNGELYEWMIAQTSGTYFQAYQLAYTVAQRAERCLRHELGLQDSSFIQFGYWDSLKKGLLSADRLLHDLRRMEAAYYTEHVRELEITKHVSLLNLDPYALVELRATGECTVRLPELLFDLDNPGHYQRRIKSVGVSVPCVVGPYGSVPLTLTLLDNHTRTSTDTSPQYARQDGDDPRFVDDMGGVQAIVTSSGQNDSGLFEQRMDDERYLPFEGTGAISTWKLRLNPVLPQFDYRTISDVVLHLRYTARDAGAVLAAATREAVRTQLNQVALAESRTGLHRLISARQEYSTEWSRFLHPAPGQDQILTIATPPDHFAFFTNGLDIKVTGIDLLAKLSNPGGYELVLTRPGAAPQTLTMSADQTLGGLHHVSTALAPPAPIGRAPAAEPHPAWTVKLRRAGAADFRSLTENEIDDLVLILRYEVTP